MIGRKSVCLVFIALTVALPAAADTARLLGSTRLTRVENDVDVLVFEPCRRGIDSVQFRVSRGQVEIERLWVRFGNGKREELLVRDRIAEGGRTRWIDLRVTCPAIFGPTES